MFSFFLSFRLIFNKFIDNSMLTLEGQEWRDRRTKLTPIFTSGKMKMMFETVDKIGDKLVDVVTEMLESSDSLEMREIAGKFTGDVIGNVAFGLDCKCGKIKNFLTLF